VARPYLARARTEGRPGVVLFGKAQERVAVWRGFVDRNSPMAVPDTPISRIAGKPRSLISGISMFGTPSGPDAGQTCGYAPYPLWVNVNGHEWVKTQLDGAGVGYRAIDNGLAGGRRPGGGVPFVRPRRPGICGPGCTAVIADPVAVDRHGPPGRVPVGFLVAPSRGVRHGQLRPAGQRPGLVRSGHQRPPRPGPPPPGCR
jgi:hypothetical protein